MKKHLLIFSLSVLTLYGNSILSKNRIELLDLSTKKIQTDSNTLKKNLISPIFYTYTYSHDDTTGTIKTSTISISQPIFKSGGIYSAIKYSNNIKTTNDIAIDIQKKELVLKALNIAYNIQKLKLQIKKQKLLIQNTTIDVKNKKESVFNGLLDIAFLNNAVINLNNQKASLLELKYNKNKLLLDFQTLSDIDLDNYILPVFTMISNESFIKDNIYIKQQQSKIKTQKNLKWINTSKYLPSVNLNYSKTINHTYDTDNNKYGFNIQIPLNITAFDDIESNKLAYLKTKKELEIIKTEQNNFFKEKILKLKFIDSKIQLSLENIKIYDQLVQQTKELVSIGDKTQDDVLVLQNSLQQDKINIEIDKIDKQLELLEIFSKINKDLSIK